VFGGKSYGFNDSAVTVTAMLMLVLMSMLTGLLMIRVSKGDRRGAHQNQSHKGAKRCKTEHETSSPGL